jgi:hypothetical protein
MIEVFYPTLLDFIMVCARLPQDEKDQMEQLSGNEFTIDGAAMGAFNAPGPKFVLKKDGKPLCIFGAVPERRGVYRDFMLNTPEAFSPENYLAVTRHVKRAIDWLFDSGQAHRIYCETPIARSRVFRWYKAIGYRFETVIRGCLVNGSDAALFARVKRNSQHGLRQQQFSDECSDSSGRGAKHRDSGNSVADPNCVQQSESSESNI